MSDASNYYMGAARPYEDLASLKKYIKSVHGKVYNSPTLTERIYHVNQTTTGTDRLIAGDAALTTSLIGSTEVTLELTCATANDASHNGKTFTLVYDDRDGDSHTAVATGTATLFATPVAFVPPGTDFYAARSFTASADFDNRDIYAKVNAGATYATITAAGTVTAATAGQLFGIGSIYGRGSADHADADAKLLYLCYQTPWGEEKFGHCTLTATSSDEIIFYEATDDGDGTTTATTTTVKDFACVVWFRSSAAATSNAYFLITDAECANANGSGGDVYAIIPNGNTVGCALARRVPDGYTGWIGRISAFWVQTAAGDGYALILNYTEDGVAKSERIVFDSCIYYSDPIPCDERTTIYLEEADTASATTLCVEVTFVEVANWA